ncbi:MAG: TetR/AcrR family transcriptional regulator [Rhodospirillaceae bacterium]|nr:TetR/AcrR family transcriptional regulator [Rhodospirillaceae bacterium]
MKKETVKRRGAETAAPQRKTRRDEYAQATRQAILDAARKLFAERGYFATKVDDIAAEARVAPATVYATSGGKYELLKELIRIWTTDPMVAATTVHIGRVSDPVEIVRELAAGSRRMREQYADIMRVVLATAPHDQAVATELKSATSIYRTAFIPVAERLAKLGALRRGFGIAHAVDVFWFYFGYTSYFTLHDDNGWAYEKAEHWLADQACRELLVDPKPRQG